ncbi:putative WW domain-containing protein [Plasmopara halstedii]
MATRGVNGATTGTLNERFIKCEGCHVNVPKEDMLTLGKCTLCGRPYEVVVTADGKEIEVATVAFDRTGITAVEKKTKQRKRWAVLLSKRGRTYYHNTETGEDRWDKPADLDADAVEDSFVPFKHDAVKKAVLREQMKLEATKMGVPIEVVAASQHQLRQEDEAHDPFTKMTEGNAKFKCTDQSVPNDNNPKRPNSPVLVKKEEEPSQQQQHGTAVEDSKCNIM